MVVEQPEIPAAVVVVAEAAKPAKETITVPKPLEAAKSTIFSPNTIAATIIESKTIQTSKAQLPNESLAKTDNSNKTDSFDLNLSSSEISNKNDILNTDIIDIKTLYGKEIYYYNMLEKFFQNQSDKESTHLCYRL